MTDAEQFNSLNSSQEIGQSLGTLDVDQFPAIINAEKVARGMPVLQDNDERISPLLLQSPRNYLNHQSTHPLPSHLSHLSISPKRSRRGSAKDLSNIRKQAIFNEKNLRNDTYTNTPSSPNIKADFREALLSHPDEQSGRNLDTAPPTGHNLDVTPPVGLEELWFNGISYSTQPIGLDVTPPRGLDLLNRTPPVGLDLSEPSEYHVLDRTWMPEAGTTCAQYKIPPQVDYSHNYSYELNTDLSRREDSGSPYNYPPDMTFANRKFNTSHGSDQSSFNRTPVNQAKKRGKLDAEFFENGRNERMDRTLNGTLNMSERSDSHAMDRTWMPETEKIKSLDKTWETLTTPDNSFGELESTNLRGSSLDKTWIPKTSANSDSEDESKPISSLLPCLYCNSFFSGKTEVVEHITAIHGDRSSDAVAAMKPQVCTNCPGNNEPVAFCDSCPANPFFCNQCVTTHNETSVKKTHNIIFLSQSNSSQDDEDTFEMLEKILNLVCPDRAVLSKLEDLPKRPDVSKMFIPQQCASSLKTDTDIEEELIMIRHESCKLAKLLKKTCGSQTSSQSSWSFNSTPSLTKGSSSLSLARKILTGEIVADNLLPIFNVDSVEVKTKVAVVIEMLLWMEAVHPSVFCDARSIIGYKSLLVVKEVKFLQKALSSLNQLVQAVGNKGIFFSLLKIKEELFEVLNTIQKQNTKPDSTLSSDFKIKNMVSAILKKMDDFIGLHSIS